MKKKIELVPFYATQRFIETVNSINHEISYQLLEMIRYKLSSPISFVDWDEKNDSISYVIGDKVVDLANKVGDDYLKFGWVKNRTSIKIGKAIKLIFGDKYPNNQPKNIEAPKPKNDVESFVNKYKAEREKNKNYDFFDIVKGEDIRYWYDQENYSRFMQEGCTLAKSCLRYKESLKFLDLYVKNPNVFSLLILKDSSNRLRGRAIVWNLNTPDRIFMDRVYSINDFDVELFKNYANEKGWLYKSRQTYGYEHNIVDTKNGEEYSWGEFIMNAFVKNINYKHFPYLDTLSIYNRETGELTNNGNLSCIAPHIKLIDPSGGFVDECEYRDMVYSDIYGDDIPREDATFVQIDNTWIYASDAIYVHNTEGNYAYKHSTKICRSEIAGRTKFFLKEDCVWSQYHKTYIYKDSVVEVYTDKTKKQVILSHKRLNGVIFDSENDIFILKEKKDEDENNKKIILNDEIIDLNVIPGTSENINQNTYITSDDIINTLNNMGSFYFENNE